MTKTYYYRKHMRVGHYVVLGFAIFMFALAALYTIIENEVNFFFIFMGIYFVFFYFLYRKFAKTEVTLTDTHFHFKNNKRDVFVTYNQIERIEHASIGYVGGWMKVKVKGEKDIKLTVVVENIADMTKTLKEKIDELYSFEYVQEQHIYNEQSLFKFYKTSAYSDQSWKRGYHFIPRLLLFNVVYIAAVIFLAFQVTYLVILGFVLTTFIMTTIYVVLEYAVYARRVAQDTSLNWDLPKNDFAQEKLWNNYLILGNIVCAFVITALMLLASQ